MKILIYTDLHCSYNSSILPLYSGKYSKFTTRLQMIIDTGKWISDIAKEQKVDMIVNGGDTFDSILVKAEELNAISEFFKSFESLDIPHIVIVGNHEKVNDAFNGSEILSGFRNVSVYKEPTKINEYLSVLPYMESDQITNDLLKSISNQLLVSHIDIQGSCLRDSYILDFGVNPELLAEHFKFTANGHLHTAEHLETSKNTVWNIGGVSSISFVDNQQYHPSIVIYDTDTNSCTRYINPHSILFRKFSIDTVKDLLNILRLSLDNKYRYAVTIKYSNYDQRSELQDILDKDTKLIAFKLISNFTDTAIESATAQLDLSTELSSLDIKSKFEEFLDTVDLKYDRKEYTTILEEL